jgi:subtilisin family serine protease
VAGIIAANRSNETGIKGVADNVQIMAIRAIPNGDERDKDVANAIRYAVDNGAQIINMSFGKDYSPDKEYVDEAVRYAVSKGVLLVHAAGNDSKDIDTENNFPTRKYAKGGQETTLWLEIGASSWGDNDNFVGNFSNYGKRTVDVFAPGVDVFSTTPGSKYESLSGTSMAAPVTSGVAALLMSYYPQLTAAQVKDIIVKSSVKYADQKVNKPGEEKGETVSFGDLSISGGVVNAYEAVKLAESMAGQK